MSYTWKEILEKLTREKEIDLLELLEITSEDIVEMFKDRINEKYEEILAEYEEEQEDLNEEWGLFDE
jgi:Mg/Co/Ni transporter MgtE